jgi:ATP-binding protein involved in chromosome partitioning
MMHQRVVGVIENMSYLPCPHCGSSHRIDVFGTGGGQTVARTLSARFGYDVPVLGEIPLDPNLRRSGDDGTPVVVSDPKSVSAATIADIAATLAGRRRDLAGLQLGLTPTGR